MQNKLKETMMRLWCLMFLLMFLPTSILAQNAKKVTGTVIDENHVMCSLSSLMP